MTGDRIATSKTARVLRLHDLALVVLPIRHIAFALVH